MTLSEVVLEPDGRLLVDKRDVIWTRTGALKRGELAAMDKFLIASIANQVRPGVFA